MYKIRFIWVGKLQDKYLQTGLDLYLKKLNPYVKIEVLEVKSGIYSSGTVKEWKAKDTERVLKKLDADEAYVFLDESGKQNTSTELAHLLEQQKRIQFSRINFLIGGPYGWDKSQFPPHSYTLSLSLMTFNHQMVRLILLEQVYRAFTIMNGEPYHH